MRGDAHNGKRAVGLTFRFRSSLQNRIGPGNIGIRDKKEYEGDRSRHCKRNGGGDLVLPKAADSLDFLKTAARGEKTAHTSSQTEKVIEFRDLLLAMRTRFQMRADSPDTEAGESTCVLRAGLPILANRLQVSGTSRDTKRER